MRMPGFSAETTVPGMSLPKQANARGLIIESITVCDCYGACWQERICFLGRCYTYTKCDPCRYTGNCETIEF